jgi:hypothetical protein
MMRREQEKGFHRLEQRRRGFQRAELDLKLTTSAAVARLLTAAAKRRAVSVAELVSQIVSGTVAKGSIDRACNGWDFEDLKAMAARELESVA